jgi:hypothetical protein
MSKLPADLSGRLVGQDGILQRVANPQFAPIGNRRAGCQLLPTCPTFLKLSHYPNFSPDLTLAAFWSFCNSSRSISLHVS